MLKTSPLIGLLAVTGMLLALSLSGCGDAESSSDEGHSDHDGHDEGQHDEDDQTAAHSHDGWWCGPHGVPEHECTRCDSSLIAQYKEKGDWCDEHDLPDSQCFKCHPELEAKFANRYEAKYGEKPPKPSDL